MASMRTIGVRLRMETGPYKRDAAEAAGATERLGHSGKKAKANLDDLAMGLGIVGAGLAAVAGVAIYAGAQFDKQMSEVGAVAGATAGELDELRQAALDAGAATAFSASEAAQAEAELAKAGIATADILGGALSGSLSLAAAGSLELATSAEIAASAMNTFGLKGKDVEHIADVLAAASNKSAAGVEDLGQGLQQVGLIANQVGFSLEETVGLLAAFADRGLKGSDGATSLKTALMRLAAPTGEASDKLEELGISLYDSNGQMVDAVSVAGQLERGLKDLSPAQRNAALNTIFGSDAIRAANVLYAEGAAGIQDYISAVDDQGAASRVAAAKLDNLAGDVEELKGSLETLAISSSGGASKGLRVLAQAATGVVNAVGELPPAVSGTGVALAGLSAIGLLTTAGALKLRSAMGKLAESLADIGPAGAKAARGLRGMTAAAGPAAAAVAGVVVAQGLVGEFLVKDLNPHLDAFTVGLKEWATTGKASGEIARVFGEDMSKLDKTLKVTTSSGHEFVGFLEEWNQAGIGRISDDSVEKSVERMKALDDALAGLVQSGEAGAAANAMSNLRARAAALGIPFEKLNEALPNYTAALEAAGPAALEHAKAAEEAAAQNVALAGAFGAAASEAGGLITAFDTLNGKTLTWREAERDAEAAADDLREALDKSNGSLDIHDEKGRAAAEAVDLLAKRGVEAAQAAYDQTGSVEKANEVYGRYRKELEKILRQAGLSKGEIDKLVDSIMQMPSSKTVTIRVKPTFDTSTLPDFVRSSLGLSVSAAAPASTGTPRGANAPRHGDYGRSMSVLSQSGGWYGAAAVPSGGWYGGSAPAAAAQQVQVTVSAAPGTDRSVMGQIVNSLRFEVRTKAQGSTTKLLDKTARRR